MKSDADLIGDECDALKVMLIEKSKAYGSSWRDPLRVFSRADPVEQLRVRIDDKITRIMHGTERDTQAVYVEDTVLDLLGYLVLFRIATRKLDFKMPEGWNDPRQEPRDTDGRECGESLDAVADVMNFQRGYVDGRSETDGEFRERIKTGLTDDMADGSRVIGYVPSDGAGFDGPYTQPIETALALETVVRDLDAGGRASLGVRDILAHHAAKLRAYAASILPKPRPDGREHLPIAYELDRVESIAARLRKENAQIKATCDQLRKELEENSDAVTKLQIEADVNHKANDALVELVERATHHLGQTWELLEQVKRAVGAADFDDAVAKASKLCARVMELEQEVARLVSSTP